MKKSLMILLLLFAGCASVPQQTISELDTTDPKYKTQACLDARNIALTYDDKVASRAGTGLALGLLLGPFGLPLAAALDSSQNGKRALINEEITRRCASS